MGVDGAEALGRSFEEPPGCLDVPVKSGNQALGCIVFHLEMNGKGDRDELDENGSPEDALVERWAVYHQELGLDGSGYYPSPKCDDQLYISPWLRASPVETLKIRTHVRG